jgi:hypothetical protein
VFLLVLEEHFLSCEFLAADIAFEWLLCRRVNSSVVLCEVAVLLEGFVADFAEDIVRVGEFRVVLTVGESKIVQKGSK